MSQIGELIVMHTYIRYNKVGPTYLLGSLILDLPHLFWSSSRQVLTMHTNQIFQWQNNSVYCC